MPSAPRAAARARYSLLLAAVLSSSSSTAAALGLGGTRWRLALSVGQEPGSWMPPTWGASQARVEVEPIVEFAEDGTVVLEGAGAWDHLVVAWAESDEIAATAGSASSAEAAGRGSPPAGAGFFTQSGLRVGRWSVDQKAERATFYLQHDGLQRGDVVLEPGRLYGTAGAWGSLLAKRGNLTIRQKKLGWIPFLPSFADASFLVGRFEAVAEPGASEQPGTS